MAGSEMALPFLFNDLKYLLSIENRERFLKGQYIHWTC